MPIAPVLVNSLMQAFLSKLRAISPGQKAKLDFDAPFKLNGKISIDEPDLKASINLLCLLTGNETRTGVFMHHHIVSIERIK